MSRMIPCVVKLTGDPRFYVVGSSNGKVISILISCEGKQIFEPLSNKEIRLKPADSASFLNCIKDLRNKPSILVCEFKTYEEAEFAAAKAYGVDYDLVDFICLYTPV
ncbi:hypothetical protein GYA37_02890 [candidate division WWE3 bacterium]|uniref:Uncharacterized protein n=1 Tax=candidate division WWE3 bacterium TaxID=2053526 RepID=A0A7X9E759_UNCKA|nr:hypothetical protein [candidate division WWE3 bacterium]